MKRKWSGDRVEKFKEFEGTELYRKCQRWAQDREHDIRNAEPTVPPELHDRAPDNWTTLLTIADLAGGQWSMLARQAAVAMTVEDDETSQGMKLLADIRTIFSENKVERIFTIDLTLPLCSLPESPWTG